MTLTQVSGSNQPVRVVFAGSKPGVLVNRDLVNPAYTSPDAGFNPQDVTASIHDALVGVPYDGTADVFAAVAPGVSIVMDYMENAQNWQPSPGQTSASLAAIAANTAATATNTAATETAVAGVNTTLGSPSQATTIVNPNPTLFNGSIQGWVPRFAIGAVALATPAPLPGCPAAYALTCTPSGGATSMGAWSGAFPVSAGGPPIMARGAICLPFADANLQAASIGIVFFTDVAGTAVLSEVHYDLAVPANGQWVWLNSGSPGATIPATAKSARFEIYITESVNIPAGEVFQVAAMTAFQNLPGTPAQDDTVGRIHDRIATTGTPLLHGYNPITSPFQQVIASLSQGASTFPVFPIAKPGYLFFVQASWTGIASGTPAGLEIEMEWNDSASATKLAQENWYVFVATTGNSVQVFGKGPTKGNSLTIGFKNVGTQPMTITYSLAETTQHIARDDWRSGTPSNVSGFTAANSDGFSNVLGIETTTVGAGSAVDRLLPLYAGQVELNLFLIPQASVVRIIEENPNLQSSNDIVWEQTFAGATSNVTPITVNLPRCPCVLEIQNTSASSGAFNWSIIPVEMAS